MKEKDIKRKELNSRFKVYGYTGSDCCGGFPAHDGFVTEEEANEIRATLHLKGFRYENKGGWRGWIEEVKDERPAIWHEKQSKSNH